VAQVLAEAGFRWVIGDEIAYDGSLGHYRPDRVYLIDGLKEFYLFFKERPASFSPQPPPSPAAQKSFSPAA